MTDIQPILDRVLAGGRMTVEECTTLLESFDVARMGVAADEVRRRRHQLRRRHLHHRPQHQLHERLQRRLHLLRLLPPAGQARHLRPHNRRHLRADRRDHRARRHRRADAGRAAPGLRHRVVRRPPAHAPRALPGLPAPLLLAARDTQHPPHLEALLRGDSGASEGGRALQHAGRRRRDSGRRGAQARLDQVHHRRVAGGDARGAPRRPAHDGDDDVRHRRRHRAPRPPPATDSRPAGRDGRLHGLHPLDVPAREHRARPPHQG